MKRVYCKKVFINLIKLINMVEYKSIVIVTFIIILIITIVVLSMISSIYASENKLSESYKYSMITSIITGGILFVIMLYLVVYFLYEKCTYDGQELSHSLVKMIKQQQANKKTKMFNIFQ